MTRILVCLDREERVENPRYPTEPILQAGGPGSGWPAPYLVATGQSGHAVVGMDIGNRFSRVAAVENEQIVPLLDAPLPSLACLTPSGHISVGYPPSNKTEGMIHHFRNLVGTEWYVESQDGFYTAQMLTEILIKRLSQMATARLDRPVSKAVLTTPASYTSLQRKMLLEAAEAAGLDVLQLINEPTAAAFAYCWENPDLEGNILVYNIGAGTFAASVMNFRNGILEVRCTIGNDDCSWNSFVDALVVWMIERFNKESEFTLELTPNTVLRMLTAAQQAIDDLHTAGHANIRLTNLDVAKSSIEARVAGYFQATISLKEYLELIEPTIVNSLAVVKDTIYKSGLAQGDIEHTLVVGDHRNLVPFWSRFYDLLPGSSVNLLNSALYPVRGAALQAALLSHSIRSFVVWDVLTEPVYEEKDGNYKEVIQRGTPLPFTAYSKCESPDATVNVHITQHSCQVPQPASLAELTINNCPPTTAGETKVEVQLIVNANGIIEYQARHIGLSAPLPITVMDGQPMPGVRRWNDPAPITSYDESRLNRLARILNMAPLTVLNVLRSRGYSLDEIKGGRAIEQMLRRLKHEKLARGTSEDRPENREAS